MSVSAFLDDLADMAIIAEQAERVAQMPLVSEIQAAVADHFELGVDELLSQRRAQYIAHPRQLAMYLSKKLTNRTLPRIGSLFGGMDHSTVIYAVRRVEDRISRDTAMIGVVANVCALIQQRVDARLGSVERRAG